ncbi:ATP-dependent DNA helicase [Trichonephila clavipes]|nr:ATP-dependent DNA helicase [Trichonephila clavipes]
MTRRKTNLSRNTRKAKSVRQVIAHQTEEERASVNERSRQRMTQIRANKAAVERATKLEGARLRIRLEIPGKTFLIKLILAAVRSENDIALALASSGIAATLLPGGRTAHSALKLPLNIHIIETPIYAIYFQIIRHGKSIAEMHIVWDECTMAYKKSLEALDRSLQDLRGNTRPFGSALILLAGDFRQTLPVIPRSTPADEINASLKHSALWRHEKTLQLTTNMRVQFQNDRSAEISSQLLDIGNGKVPADLTSGKISLPHNFCNLVATKGELVERVFSDIQTNFKNPNWLSECHSCCQEQRRLPT